MLPPPNPAPTAANVGTGSIAPVHLQALRRLAIPVRRILGSTPERSSTAACPHGLDVGCASFAGPLADQAVPVVHLTSPNRRHHGQARQALAAGKNMICEKPLGKTSAETTELVTAEAVRREFPGPIPSGLAAPAGTRVPGNCPAPAATP